MHVDGFGRPALEVDAAEGEDVLAVGSWWDAFVGYRAVVDIVDCVFEFLQAELQAGAAREEEVFHIGYVFFAREFGGGGARVGAEVRAFGEDEEPHRV